LSILHSDPNEKYQVEVEVKKKVQSPKSRNRRGLRSCYLAIHKYPLVLPNALSGPPQHISFKMKLFFSEKKPPFLSLKILHFLKSLQAIFSSSHISTTVANFLLFISVYLHHRQLRKSHSWSHTPQRSTIRLTVR